jgi:GNAT superfamily N-acetyltransferase
MILVRSLQITEAELAATAVRLLKGPPPRDARGIGEQGMRRFLASPRNIFVAATDGAQPVGYAVAYELARIDRRASMILLYEIAVAETRRRQGIGTAILGCLKNIARQRCTIKMWVLADEGNLAADRLYTSAGARRQGANLLYEWDAGSFA